jgi:hypothetical protein
VELIARHCSTTRQKNSPEQRRGRALRLDERQERFIAAQAELLSGEALFRGQRSNHAPRREAFLAAITERLATSPVVGPGAVMTAGRELQRQYFDPPDLHGGQTGRRV